MSAYSIFINWTLANSSPGLIGFLFGRTQLTLIFMILEVFHDKSKMKIMKNAVGKFAITWSDWVFVLRSDSLLIGGGGAERYGGPLRFGFCWRTGWGNLSDNMAIVRYEKLISNISDI